MYTHKQTHTRTHIYIGIYTRYSCAFRVTNISRIHYELLIKQTEMENESLYRYSPSCTLHDISHFKDFSYKWAVKQTNNMKNPFPGLKPLKIQNNRLFRNRNTLGVSQSWWKLMPFSHTYLRMQLFHLQSHSPHSKFHTSAFPFADKTF